ncbi:MAG: DUF4249 domain-containing protein [Bacteroidota bacterium]|jgi:hypothetical protein
MKLQILSLIAGLAALASCNLTKDVDIELPSYTGQPVVECYLEPGKPFRLLLTQGYSYFDPFGLDSTFLQKTLLNGATVTISYDGKTDTLYNVPTFELSPVKIFNYTGWNKVPATPGLEYTLQITLPGGATITGSTSMLPPVPIDSVVCDFNPDPRFDTLARVLTFITDDLTTENFYRRMLHYSSLDSFPQQDFLVTDRFSEKPMIAFGTGYELKEGDTVYNTIYHINRAHYDYSESVQLAVIANLNPFAQPSRIKSNVSGTADPVGIFTCLVYDRDTTIIRK